MVKRFVASVAGKEEEDGQGAEISCPLDAVSPRFTSQLSCYTLLHTRVGTPNAKKCTSNTELVLQSSNAKLYESRTLGLQGRLRVQYCI